MKLTDLIWDYYTFRAYSRPKFANWALLWLLSEIGEMVEAFLDTKREPITSEERRLYFSVMRLAKEAESLVENVHADAVRNGDRAKPHNLSHEIGDCLQMLGVFADLAGVGDPVEAMTGKFESKGWKIPADVVPVSSKRDEI
jgi:NTP pyrophosphatase (non-canonical NTP hydrolase)